MKNDFDSPSKPLVQAIRTDCYTELALKKNELNAEMTGVNGILIHGQKR